MKRTTRKSHGNASLLDGFTKTIAKVPRCAESANWLEPPDRSDAPLEQSTSSIVSAECVSQGLCLRKTNETQMWFREFLKFFSRNPVYHLTLSRCMKYISSKDFVEVQYWLLYRNPNKSHEAKMGFKNNLRVEKKLCYHGHKLTWTSLTFTSEVE